MNTPAIEDVLTSAADLRQVIDLVPSPVFVKDSAHRWRLLNKAMAALLGQPEPALLGKSDFDLFPPDQAEKLWAKDNEVLCTGQPVEHEQEVAGADGQIQTFITRKCLIRVGPGGTTKLIVCVLSDITQYRAAEARFRILADHNTDLIIQTDLQFRRHYVSPSVQDMLGYSPEEFLKMGPGDIIHPDDLDTIFAAYDNMSASNRTEANRYRYRRKDGSFLWVEGIGRRLMDRSGFVITVRDVTHRLDIEHKLEQANQRLEILAMQDGLTGLANRRQFDQRLDAEMDRAARAMAPLSLILIDVDHFKAFNDTYGHVNGDDCLRAIADAVRTALHRPADLAARYGGEEIAALLPDTEAEGAIRIAESIRGAVHALDREHITAPCGIVTISAGVATIYPDPAMPPGRPSPLVVAADHALYQAKEAGRDRIVSAPPRAPRQAAPFVAHLA